MLPLNHTLFGSMIPLMGTTLGAVTVLLPRIKRSLRIQALFLGFAAGVMVAASVWSLLLPAIDRCAGHPVYTVLLPSLGYTLGMLFLLLMDKTIPHQHLDAPNPEGLPSQARHSLMLVFAITLHNIPEGMAVGAVLSALKTTDSIPVSAAYALCLGIAIQNIPEGAVVSLPLGSEVGRRKAALCGFLSGVVEPIAALITVALSGLIVPLLPVFLSFAAGAMLYVVVEELIPEATSSGGPDLATLAFASGFLLMMILDVAMG